MTPHLRSPFFFFHVLFNIKLLYVSIIASLFTFPLVSVAQDYEPVANCNDHNSFLKNGKINLIAPLVSRVRHDGTLYLDLNKVDSLESVFEKWI